MTAGLWHEGSGGGKSRDIWRLEPLCIKRWLPRIPPTEVRLRCRVSREIPVCNRMWYVPRLHWTVARWVIGEPATHEACNRLLARSLLKKRTVPLGACVFAAEFALLERD